MAEHDAAVAVPATTLWASPDSPRPVDEPILRDRADPAAWAAALDRPARLDLHGRILTQLLLGEPVVVLAEHGDWVEVCAPWQPSAADARGYRGWLRSAHLAAPPAAAGLAVTVSLPWAVVECAPPVIASWATMLPVLESAGSRVVVALPGGATGRLERDVVTVRSATAPVTGFDPLAPVRSARMFLGLDYLWGGTTGWGLDCSGLVHQAFRSHGIRVPRDAADQQLACTPVDLDDVRPGDLYFFGHDDRVTHVGFATSAATERRHTMLHAPEESRYVEDAELEPERLAALVGVGRVTNPTWLNDQNPF